MPELDEQPGEDIRSILSQAVTASETAAEPAGETRPAEATPAPEQTERLAAERKRAPDGKFVAKEEGETGAAETPDVPETPETVETEEVETEPKIEEPPVAVPQHWSQADKDMIAGLPKEAQPKVVDRIKAMEAGFTPKLQRAAQMEKEFAPIIEMFAPHVEGLRQRNQTPADVIKAWGNVEMELQRGGQGAASRVAGIIKAYKIDPGVVAQYLMGEQPSPPAPGNDNRGVAEVPPELMRELSDLKQRVNAREQSEYAARQATISQTIDNFISEKDATGALKHPFYSEVERDMEVLARIEISQGKTPDVADLYDRAVYANRETRTKLLAAQEAEVRRKAAAERKAKAVAAQNAGSSVAGSPGSGQSPSANRSGARSLREELEANVAEHDARA